MIRMKRLSPEEIEDLKDLLSEDSAEHLLEEIVEEMSSYLFGIFLDYGANDTEVRDWIYTEVKKRGL